ncbi:carboxy-S-adenosyl-L-methionine synthase CmoA [Microbulbifer thermotolerans]|uniref:Carboxy-S-adenosyl-L-methionine synthase n=2 Tax=Microbulbifer thermotolerans TaxID=252514 RepID=A0A143HLQ3_MICTH|nr:carboxy-S-adenosyl-L-methionine synthase CmoA [Microbulbifer thermotolerans]AMX02426.1 tRNA (cmo5U34)-methyltransferase [Microbulbifer thermotolerans]MCX2784571.1 carboxy-S-adenosyl-L-methionine synthase CmoA [Microbulbifer thermotolerans]MCX2795225.1 carboxy-S-adenosyl-L-methionine synthase CmoA [Microbulbifer thermotolerans]MCX2802846.1 carboxy-S-adenosyl-L-methionine synthase CmoA [Microbulbifer thermotolerans]MCX2832704.1 carboxy-S-adenosyl-L-methionine synthase CmoA [Microbulbifer ther
MGRNSDPQNHGTAIRRDNIYASPLGEVSGFTFDQSVVDVFPDMIQRSVPGYTTIVAMIGTLAERYAQAGSRCYDLGSSLCAATLAMRHRIPAADCEIIAVDNSEAMVEQARKVLAADSGRIPVQLICDDLQNVRIENASVVVLNFTLQFVPVADRLSIARKIYDGLRPGGILIISEKVDFTDPDHRELMIDLHHAFKRANGYSELEIAQKRTALENVLIPETLDTHRERLKAVGFTSVDVWFQCFNFASLIAIKAKPTPSHSGASDAKEPLIQSP